MQNNNSFLQKTPPLPHSLQKQGGFSNLTIDKKNGDGKAVTALY
jgi:hypothetical protein